MTLAIPLGGCTLNTANDKCLRNLQSNSKRKHFPIPDLIDSVTDINKKRQAVKKRLVIDTFERELRSRVERPELVCCRFVAMDRGRGNPKNVHGAVIVGQAVRRFGPYLFFPL